MTSTAAGGPPSTLDPRSPASIVHQTIGALLAHHATVRPDATALIFEGRQTSYAELDALAARVAVALISSALPPGTRIAYLGRNTDRSLALLYGCARSGMVFTPLNWRLAREELQCLLDDASVPLLFVSSEYADVASHYEVESIVDVETGWESWLSIGRDALLSHVSACDDVVLQIYTSGTTGSPKGVEMTQAAILAAASMALTGRLGEWSCADRLLIALPLFHVAGLLTSSLALAVGAACSILRDAEVSQLARASRSDRITKLGTVPTLLQMIVGASDFRPSDFSTVQTIIYGGSPISLPLLVAARREIACEFIQVYGTSETYGIGTALAPQDHSPEKSETLSSCGRALPGVDILIVDQHGHKCEIDKPGAILIRTPSVMKGYWRRPETTDDVLVDGWYRTGDIGSVDDRGYLTIKARSNDLIITGGENVFPTEVETALASHPAVADCAVFGRADPKWGQTIAAIVVLRPEQTADKEALIVFVRTKVAAYKCPRDIRFVEAIPKNFSGKVERSKLPDLLSKDYVFSRGN